MTLISIISSSVRTGRNSHRVSLYLQKYLSDNTEVTADIIDLMEYDFPIFHERLKFLVNPTSEVVEFTGRIKSSSGIVIVTPEYNGGYPASLKNVIDLLYDEWHRKPVAIATVSTGVFGGSQAVTSLQFTLWKMHAWTVPATFPVPQVKTMFDVSGNATDSVTVDKLAKPFINELLWCIEAKNRMDEVLANGVKDTPVKIVYES
jgi:NAD(P)H-dependent FMN reductase